MVETKWDSAWNLPPQHLTDNSVVGFQPLSQMSTPVFPNTYLRIVSQSITCAKIRFWKLFSPEQETLFFNEWSKKASLTEILLVFYIDKTKTWTDTWKRRKKMLNLFTFKFQNWVFCIHVMKIWEFSLLEPTSQLLILFSLILTENILSEIFLPRISILIGRTSVFKPSLLTTFNSRSPPTGNAVYNMLCRLLWWKFNRNPWHLKWCLYSSAKTKEGLFVSKIDFSIVVSLHLLKRIN